MSRLRTSLRTGSLIILLTTGGWWFFAGAHGGWSMNRVPINKTDDVTGITYVEYEERFVPGVDVIFAGAGIASLALLSSLFVRSKPKNSSS
jgi:hypothetical protein